MPATRSITVSQETAGRVDRVVQQLTRASRSQVQGLFDHHCVRVDGALCEESFSRVVAGQRVEVSFDAQRRYRPKPKAPRDAAYDLRYEDEHLLVVDKAAFVLTVPTGQSEMNTLEDRLNRYVERRMHKGRVFVVHRLDRGVSGLLVFAKTRDAGLRLKSQFAAHKPDRRYVAVVAGHVKPAQGTIESHLATGANLDRYSVRHAREGQTQHAVTHYRTLHSSPRGVSVLEVRLETGRRNQIRVHLAEKGHPVLGDPRYRTDLAQHPLWRINRLALHAVSLAFDHPITGKRLSFTSELPAPIRAIADETPAAGRPRSS